MDGIPEDITAEQIAKVKACKSAEDILALAKEEGVEITEEQLDAISGGNALGWVGSHVPQCKG